MQKKMLFKLAVVATSACFVFPAAAEGWNPDRPINLIVPWAAGGSTDQITRINAAELEKILGQTIVIVNQPGASGAIGTRNALTADKDGYTWTAGAAQDLGAYQTLGSLDSSIDDWHLFLNVANVSVLGANPDTPWKNAAELIEDMKARPGKVSVATAGVTSAGHAAMDRVVKGTDVKYKEVTYDGGNPAVLAAVSGETDLTSQLAVEQADMIRGKRLRPLATVGSEPLELEGYGTIPALSETVPGLDAPLNYFGIFIPKGVPDEVIETMQKIWAEKMPDNEAMKKYATTRGAIYQPLAGDAAKEAAMPAIQLNAWNIYESGKAKVSPDTVGIPKP